MAVRLLCSRTGAVKFATELTVRRLSLLFPMVVLLPWAAKAAVMVVGELMVRAVLVPEEPMMVAPAGKNVSHCMSSVSCPPRRCTVATSLHGNIMQACSMTTQLCACCVKVACQARVPGQSVAGAADLPVKVVGAFMRRALAVPACPIWTVEYTVKTALLPEPLPKVLAPACGSQGVQLLSFNMPLPIWPRCFEDQAIPTCGCQCIGEGHGRVHIELGRGACCAHGCSACSMCSC